MVQGTGGAELRASALSDSETVPALHSGLRVDRDVFGNPRHLLGTLNTSLGTRDGPALSRSAFCTRVGGQFGETSVTVSGGWRVANRAFFKAHLTIFQRLLRQPQVKASSLPLGGEQPAHEPCCRAVSREDSAAVLRNFTRVCSLKEQTSGACSSPDLDSTYIVAQNGEF